MQKTYEVKGMTCVICKNTVETGLKKLNGVSDCKVNLLENEAIVDFDENIVNELLLADTIKDLGYELLIDKKMSKADLRKAVEMSPNTLTKMRKEEEVSMGVLLKIAKYLNCDISDMVEFINEDGE